MPDHPGSVGSRSADLAARKQRAVPDAIANMMPVFATRAEGAFLWDADGHRYIDLAGGVGCMNVGHSHPRVVAAITEQASRFTHTDFTIVPYEGYVAVAERLAALTPGPSPKQAALFNSGAEAVENAAKVARLATGRPALIAFEGGFHGRTQMALTLTGRVNPYKKGMAPFAPEVYRAPYPYPYRSPVTEATGYVMDRLEEMFATHVDPGQVAGIIVEPVLGEGGFVVPPPDFLPALRDLCDRRGILLIVDEVQTGMGRTGKMFAVEHAGIEPDLMVVGKSIAAGLPLSALVGRREIFAEVPPQALGGTYVGNPVACAAALAVLDIMASERLPERAARLGALLRQRLTAMAREHPLIGEVRGLGAMMGFELVTDPRTKAPAAAETAEVVSRALAEGVIVLTAGVRRNVIRFLMPLTIPEETLEDALTILDRVLGTVRADGPYTPVRPTPGE